MSKKAKKTNATTVSSRAFQQQFSQVADALRPGESVTVTKHGEPIGTFIKVLKPKPAPDYLGNLHKLGYSAKDGQRVIDVIHDLS